MTKERFWTISQVTSDFKCLNVTVIIKNQSSSPLTHCKGNPWVTGGFPSQKANHVESIAMSSNRGVDRKNYIQECCKARLYLNVCLHVIRFTEHKPITTPVISPVITVISASCFHSASKELPLACFNINKTSYHKISWKHKTARIVVKITVLHWNVTAALAAVQILECSDNSKCKFCGVFVKSYNKMFCKLVKQTSEAHCIYTFSYSYENIICFNSIPGYQTTANSYTCHGSNATAPCAKFCNCRCVRIWLRGKGNYLRIGIMMAKTWGK